MERRCPVSIAMTDPAALEDAALAARLRAGELAALDVIYSRHAGRLLGLAYRLTNSREDAEEIVQDVFVGLPLALRGYAEQGTFGPWLRRITARLSIDRLRKAQRHRETDLEAYRVGFAPNPADRVDARLTLERAVAKLPDGMRAVFVLREVEGYSHAEIAQLLGIRRGTSEVRLLRGIRQLRNELEADK